MCTRHLVVLFICVTFAFLVNPELATLLAVVYGAYFTWGGLNRSR